MRIVEVITGILVLGVVLMATVYPLMSAQELEPGHGDTAALFESAAQYKVIYAAGYDAGIRRGVEYTTQELAIKLEDALIHAKVSESKKAK